MDPFFAKNRLSAYIDDQLSAEEAAEIRRALEEDDALRAEYESLSAAVALLRKHGPTSAPAGFHDKVMAQVGSQRSGVLVVLQRFLRQTPVEAIALAAAAVLVIVIVGMPGDETLSPAVAPPAVEVKGGAAAPPPRIEPSSELSLPLTAPEVVEAKEIAPAAPESKKPTKEEPSRALRQVPVEPPPEVYVAEWEQQDTTDSVPAIEKSPATRAEAADLTATPRELYGGVSAETATPYQYRITLGDAQVLYSLQQLAQRTEGRLLDSNGGALTLRSLDVEQNYARVQLVVPPGKADEVHDWLKALGAQASLPESASPLYGADYVAFLIEVTYLP